MWPFLVSLGLFALYGKKETLQGVLSPYNGGAVIYLAACVTRSHSKKAPAGFIKSIRSQT